MSAWLWIVIIVAIVLLIVLIILFAREKGKNKKPATNQPENDSAAKIAFKTSRQTIQAGSVSGMIIIQIQDVKGNPVKVPSNTIVSLSSSSSGGIFSADGNEPAMKAVTVYAGTDSANFYYKDSAKGNPVIIASNNELAPDTQTETIN
jgi:preprotein translocase subunit SecG